MSLGVYIYIWSDEFHAWSLILALKNTKLWVELIASCTGKVFLFVCFFQFVRVSLTSEIFFTSFASHTMPETRHRGAGRESKG